MGGARRRRAVFALGVGLATLACGDAAARSTCRGAADGRIAEGWRHYHVGRLEDARSAFGEAFALCPTHPDAMVGRGYVALREGVLDEARDRFESAVAQAPRSVDALSGLGIASWRSGDLLRARELFERVVELDPGNVQAIEYLARYPSGVRPGERPPVRREDTLAYPARTTPGGFQVRAPSGWEPFWVKGVNLRGTLPGTHPSEFPDSATYAQWFRLLAAMGANTVRAYSAHPPSFYGALLDHNRRRPLTPLWLLQEIPVSRPPADDYGDPEWHGRFVREARELIDVVHGRADVPARFGAPYGSYVADVSPWTLAWVVGGPWDPASVAAYNRLRPTRRSWSGEFFVVEDGSPMDAWLAQALEEVASYETGTYGAQRPLAFGNWPGTDPLGHPSEGDPAEEAAILRRLGQRGDPEAPPPVGEDDVSLDPVLVRATERLAAGHFAAYQAYPFYPDFLFLGSVERDPTVAYAGYLARLREHHGELPVLISAYGVPASLGIGHIHPGGLHQGGHPESRMARAAAGLTRDIAAAGMAGGVISEWLDGWYRSNWVTSPFEAPGERAPLWKNALDPDEHYGIVALEPVPAVAGESLEERLRSWEEIEPLYRAPDGSVLRARADAGSVWLLVEPGPAGSPPDEILIGFDVIDERSGDFAWPDSPAGLPFGLEFVLRIAGDTARLLAHPPVNRILLDVVPPSGLHPGPRWPAAEDAPAGLFQGGFARRIRLPLRSEPSRSGLYEPILELPNRTRYGRDSVEYAAVGWEPGLLPAGPPPDGWWERAGDRVLVRVPWQLLGFGDPSRRAVISHEEGFVGRGLGTVEVEGIRIAYAFGNGGEIRSWPRAGPGPFPLLTWDRWDTPDWRARLRPVYDSLRETWASLGPRAIAEEMFP